MSHDVNEGRFNRERALQLRNEIKEAYEDFASTLVGLFLISFVSTVAIGLGYRAGCGAVNIIAGNDK